MGTYESFSVGDRFHTPSRTLDDVAVRALISHGGFTHPLFTDPEFAAASAFGKTPLPGQAVLMVMGGLLEQSGRFDDNVIALLNIVPAPPCIASAGLAIERVYRRDAETWSEELLFVE